MFFLNHNTCEELCEIPERYNKVIAVKPAVSVWGGWPLHVTLSVRGEKKRDRGDRNVWVTSQERWMFLKPYIWVKNKHTFKQEQKQSEKQGYVFTVSLTTLHRPSVRQNHRSVFSWATTWTRSSANGEWWSCQETVDINNLPTAQLPQLCNSEY